MATITPRFESDGTLVIQYRGDAQSLVDHCATAAREDRERRDFKSHHRRRLLSVPREVMYKVAIDHGIPFNDTQAIWKVLMSRDYSRFRTLDTGNAYKQLRPTRRSGVVSIKR